MTLQSSGQISFSQINTELGRSSTATISIKDAELGNYGTINAASTSKPNGSSPYAISEWYSYNHNASSYTSPLVKTGLIQELDAGIVSSYPGSGSTWYDLSGNGNNATLYNGPTFSSGTNDSGSLILDGTNDTIDTGMTIQAATNSTLQSFGAWMYGSGTDYSFFGSNASGGGQHHIILALAASFVSSNPDELTYAASYYGGGGETDYTVGIARNTPNWNYACIVKTAANTYDVYFNGTAVLTNVFRNANTNTTLVLGQWWSYYFKPSQLAMVHTYNTALSSTDVLNNYNNTKGRFGL